MATEAQIAAYEGGKLRLLASGEAGREVVIALPLSRLLVRMVRVPAESDPIAVATPILKAASPFPDEELTVSCELVREDERGKVVLAAALPESAADDLGEALDAAKLSVVRIDSLVLGQLRGVWRSLGDSAGRRMVLVRSVDCLSIIVLDGDLPVALRAITELSDIRREVMLSLLEAEDFGGAHKLEEIVLVEAEALEGAPAQEGDDAPQQESVDLDALASFAPVRKVAVGADAALVGVRERSFEDGAINALPASWREMLEETRFKAKLVRRLAVAGGIWLLAIGVLFGVPMAYGFMTNHQKSLSRQHARQYAEVKEMKAKVDLIHKYSDHARGALEIMKAVSDRLPEGVTLTSWSYKRDEGLRVTGEAETDEAIYVFKDAMDVLSADDADGNGERIFPSIELNGPNASRDMYKFELDCRCRTEEGD